MKTITHALDDFMYQLFPDVTEGDRPALQAAMEAYFGRAGKHPAFVFEEQSVTLTLDGEFPKSDEEKYGLATELFEKKDYEACIQILKEMVQEKPWEIEPYAMLCFVCSLTDKFDLCIEFANDGLKWHPENTSFLHIAGNAYAEGNKDFETAISYYKKAHSLNPEDAFPLRHIPTYLFHSNRHNEAYGYIEKLIDIDPDDHLGYQMKGLYYFFEKDYLSCFMNITEALRKADVYRKSGQDPDRDPVDSDVLTDMAVRSAENYIEGVGWNDFTDKIKDEMVSRLGVDIRFELYEEENPEFMPGLERAVPHGRDYHLIRYIDSEVTYVYLMMSQFIHLELSEAAVKESAYRLFSLPVGNMFKYVDKFIKFFAKKVRSSNMDQFEEILFSAVRLLQLAVTETPLFVLINETLYHRYKTFRPFLFISLKAKIDYLIYEFNENDFSKNLPPDMMSVLNMYHLVYVLHFKKLFGVDHLKDFRYKKHELNRAIVWFDEALGLFREREPGEEFDLIEFWAKDVKLDRYLEIREVRG